MVVHSCTTAVTHSFTHSNERTKQRTNERSNEQTNERTNGRNCRRRCHRSFVVRRSSSLFSVVRRRCSPSSSSVIVRPSVRPSAFGVVRCPSLVVIHCSRSSSDGLPSLSLLFALDLRFASVTRQRERVNSGTLRPEWSIVASIVRLSAG